MTTREEAEAVVMASADRPITAAEFGLVDSRAKAIASLVRLVAVKEQQKALADEREMLEQAIRLEMNADHEPLIDGEHGIVASLREKSKPASIDLTSMAKHPDQEQYIVEAARAGLLNVALVPLRALAGKAAYADAMLDRYLMPGGATYELRVEEVK